MRAGERQASCRLLQDSAAPLREWSDDSLGNPTWLCGPRAHTRDDLNSQFLAVLAHELRNSLCVIRMAAGILKMELPASPAVGKARTLIEHQTAHMSRLVEDLLDTSRARNGHLALKCKKVDLCVVAAQALQSVEFTMQQSGHCMTVSLPVGSLWLQGDPARLEQVFVNLLLNAAKYTLSGGNIHLSVEREEGEALVRIRDNGIGIAPDVLPRVFDLFVQADPSSNHRGAGLGIGLALVRNLVDSHGGCVTAASLGLGFGSEFVVRLPMLIDEVDISDDIHLYNNKLCE
jgi:signal transduction histidine kinase